MPPKPKSLTTAADDLLDILKRVGELSFKDAAKRLNVSVQTIEAWATFLEEDGVLAVKYKMTTPYLIILPLDKSQKGKKSSDSVFQDNLAEAEIKSVIEKALELLDLAEKKRTEGEFGVLGNIYDQLLTKLKKLTQFISSLIYVSPQEKASLMDQFFDVEKRIKQASELLKINKFDDASRAYSDLHLPLQDILNKVNSYYSEVEEIKESRNAGLKKLLDRTYALLEEGKLEEALSNYEKTKMIFAKFSQQSLSEESSIRENILKLNRDITIYSNKIKRQRMQDGLAKINDLLRLSKENIQSRKFAMATAYYLEIKKVFEGLPAGFAKEKRRLKEEILAIFEQISKERERRLESTFGRMSKDIERLLEESNESIKAGNVGNSFKTYKRLSKLYSQLPYGFLKEKFRLQRMIISLYNLLSERLERKAEHDLSAEESQILGLLERMKQQTDSGKFAEANATYSEINSIFEQLPEGFVQQKTALQEKIISLYEKLLESMDSKKFIAFKSSLEGVNRLINECQECVKKLDYTKANAIYREVKEAYTKLLPLDVLKRQDIRNRILALYRSIMLGEQALKSRSLQINEPVKLSAKIPGRMEKDNIHQKIEALKSRSKAKVRLIAC